MVKHKWVRDLDKKTPEELYYLRREDFKRVLQKIASRKHGKRGD